VNTLNPANTGTMAEMKQFIGEGPEGFEALFNRFIDDNNAQLPAVPDGRFETFHIALECTPGAAAERAADVCKLLGAHRVGKKSKRPIALTAVLHKDTRLLCWFRIKKGGSLMSKKVDTIFHRVTGVIVRQVLGQQRLTDEFFELVVSMFEAVAPASFKFPAHGKRPTKPKSKPRDKDPTWSGHINKLLFEHCPPGENLEKHKAAGKHKAITEGTRSDNVGGVFTARTLGMRTKAFKKLFDIVQDQLHADGPDDPVASLMSPGEAIARLRANRTNLVQCAKLELQSRRITNSFEIRNQLGSTLSDLQEAVDGLKVCETAISAAEAAEEAAAQKAAEAAAEKSAEDGAGAAADMNEPDADETDSGDDMDESDLVDDEAVEGVPSRGATPEPGFVE
jgi:hypothetical protein